MTMVDTTHILQSSESTRPLSGGMGLEISGFRFTNEILEEAHELKMLLANKQILVFRDQNLSESELVKIALCFGVPLVHPLKQFRHTNAPEILLLSNLIVQGKKTGVHDGAAYWHCDNSYSMTPAFATMLSCKSTPLSGGETLFVDMKSAYKRLSSTEKRELENLIVEHTFGNRDYKHGRSAAPKIDDPIFMSQIVYHPLVKTHPLNGKRSLYGISGSSIGIKGVPNDEALKLLRFLSESATSDQYIYRHLHKRNDLIIWDNYTTMHSAVPVQCTHEKESARILYRISVA